MHISHPHGLMSAIKIFLSCCLIIVFSGCSLLEIKEQTEAADKMATITGMVDNKSAQKGKITVVLISSPEKNQFFVEIRITADDDGRYLFPVKPGIYYIAAFIDLDQNGFYSKGEHARVYKNFSPILLVNKQIVTANIDITGQPEWSTPSDAKVIERKSLSMSNIGRIVSLDDPMFSIDVGPLGLWRPLDYLEKYGAGLFLLQEYDKKKIPVIFVHGANATSNDWRTMINNIDHERYQPWVFNYPSGVRLDLVSEFLKLATNDLQNKYKMKKVYVVAHSMGGLVTRLFIKKYYKSYPAAANNIKFVMTINSPMMGIESAQSGVKYSPILVPSWRDVATGSEFIRAIHAWGWPEGLPYHLVFSYMSGDGDDGVVNLESQIPLKLQSEATRIYGFNNSHAGILKDRDFIGQFNKILRESLN